VLFVLFLTVYKQLKLFADVTGIKLPLRTYHVGHVLASTKSLSYNHMQQMLTLLFAFIGDIA